MKKTRSLIVSSTSMICANMLRVTFAGNDLKDFPEDAIGDYVKLMFPKNISNTQEYFQRPYTIRKFRKDKLELDIDFANHKGDKGIATKWAYSANIGDKILVSGPSSKESININFDWFFFVGDMSALPAISAKLEKLDKNSSGIAIIEVTNDLDKLNLDKPDNLNIVWVINQSGYKKNTNLFNTVCSYKWPKGNPYVWVACEFNNMKKLRDFFQIKKQIKKTEMYISSYWKSGINQEGHKKIKKKDNLNWISS